MDRIREWVRRLKPGATGGPDDRTLEADFAEAWEFKRRFFWTAFKALEFNGIDGDYAEFGCHGGKTFRLAYDQISRRTMDRHMWAFDSFQGLPDSGNALDDHPVWVSGAMRTEIDAFHEICRSHGIARTAYSTVEGYYEQTLPGIPGDAAPSNIALAYIDCDLYSSTMRVLEFLVPRLKHGMILAFDDYYCWSANQVSGERKAVLEVFEHHLDWHLHRYRDIGWPGTSFVVERKDLLGP